MKGTYPVLETSTVLAAVSSVSQQNYRKLMERVLKLYRATHFKDDCISIVHSLVQEKLYSLACRLACCLELYHSFGKDEFVLPLILQDRSTQAEEYILHNTTMQKEIVVLLDKHVNNPQDLLGLVQ